jgi:putative hydrolase of the HAD superfamily
MPLVLFDLDNTLIDRQRAMARWAAEFTAARGLDGAAEQHIIATLRDRAYRESFVRLRQDLALSEPADQMWTSYVEGLAAKVSCRPEVLTGLDELRAAGWTVGILTNGSQEIQHAKVTAAGLNGRVDAVCVSEDIGARKPDLAAFRAAAERCRHDLRQGGWMVGDNPDTDIAGATAAGLSTTWIAHGRPWPYEHAGPDRTADDVLTAIDILLAEPRG